VTSPDAVLDKTDAGDDVAARFNYQHCYAAIYAIRLITDAPNIAEIICENHEDILIKKPTGKFIGIQIKTRLPTQPAFKARDEQVKNALGRFCALDRMYPDTFEKFDFTTNHTFWDDEESKSNLPWLVKAIQERGGIKGLRAENPLRQFVEGIAGGAAFVADDAAEIPHEAPERPTLFDRPGMQIAIGLQIEPMPPVDLGYEAHDSACCAPMFCHTCCHLYPGETVRGVSRSLA
jgi:Cap4 dsDNA endonuclease